MQEFETVVAIYGTVDIHGNLLTEQAAMDIFNQLSQQAGAQMPGMHGYRIVDVRIEGDREQGKVYATFQHPSIKQEPIDLASQRTKRAMHDLATSSDVLEGDLSNGLETLPEEE